jgi:cytochrome c oxidase cbb3-type subunit 3
VSARFPIVATAAVLAVFSAGCEREARRFTEAASQSAPAGAVRASSLQAGGPSQPSLPATNPYEENAYAVSQGQRLFTAFNCVGCHAHGGGGMGPALMDDKWIYGAQPANIYQTIVQGRPNGMPAFGGKIADAQVWQIVAYVRSMSGQVDAATAPGRTDSLAASKPESTRERETPRQGGTAHPQ